jgi:hypothetical protein
VSNKEITLEIIYNEITTTNILLGMLVERLGSEGLTLNDIKTMQGDINDSDMS